MVNGLFLSVTIVTLCAALFKVRGMWKPHRSPALASLCVLLTSLGFSFFFLAPAVQSVENNIFPNLGRLLANCLTLLAAFAMLAILLHLGNSSEAARRKMRSHLVVLGVLFPIMAVLFLMTPLPPIIGDFGDYYRTKPSLVLYNLIYIAGLGTALFEYLIMSWRYARYFDHRKYLRYGLRITGVGCGLGLVYLAEKGSSVLMYWLEMPQIMPGDDRRCSSLVSPPGCAFRVTLPAVSTLVITFGATLPVWGPALAAPGRWLWYARTYWKLRPLWAALYAEMPEIALTVTKGARAYFPHDMAFRVYRRIIEIRDGYLLLRPYRHPDVGREVRAEGSHIEMKSDDLDAVVEAAEIASALTARRRGYVQWNRQDSVLDALPTIESIDIREEAACLVRVSTAFARSPIVRKYANDDIVANVGDGGV